MEHTPPHASPAPPDTGAASVKKQRILFVDDMRTILLSLERLLRRHRNEWEMAFAHSAAEALDLLEKEAFDIIVSDVVMPEMNGVQLLEIVKERYPSMIRFILSGHADYQTVIQSVGSTHQFMAKPCDRAILTDAISRALSLRNLFKKERLLHVVKDAASIPTLPELYQELTAELALEHSSTDRVAQIIAKDMTISAKVLQLVNSAFFGLSRRIDDITQAVTLLGAETINSIVLTTSVFSQFNETQVSHFDIREIYGHSISVGAEAARLAQEALLPKRDIEEALLAGMMHDLGLLALIDSGNETWKSLYMNRHTSDTPLHIQEREQLGVTHAEVGAYLLGVWGISNTVVEAVAFHHNPADAAPQQFSPLTAVYLANYLNRKQHNPTYSVEELDHQFLADLGCDQPQPPTGICTHE